MDSTLAQRLRMRKEKPRLSFWDLSGEDSESDKEERPKKKIKPIVNIEESAIQQREQSPPSWGSHRSSEIRPTFKEECKQVDPKLLEKLGYINRNCRPPSSKRKEILTSVDDKRSGHSMSINEKNRKEEAKIQQIKQLLETQRNN